MLLFPESIEKQLEVDQIRKLVANYCITESAVTRIYNARPIENPKKLKIILEQTDEFIKILSSGIEKPSFLFEDIQLLLVKIKVPGTFLEGEDLLVLNIGLKAIQSWQLFFEEHRVLFPTLYDTVKIGAIDSSLISSIDRIIDERGEVIDHASPELTHIRKGIVTAEKKVRTSIHRILESSKKESYSEDDASVTIRDGRLVIPVKSEFKRRLAGFVHDESSTGQTVFMEPSEVLELNNEVRELKYREKREIQRILLDVSDVVRNHLMDLDKGARNLIVLDFIHAKARFAVEFDAVIPSANSSSMIDLKNARHPILWDNHKKQGRTVVPLTISLNHQDRFLIISGPNAGGKSVALKTIGLLQFMHQCGFPVTVDPDSEMGFFNHIFIDIGDSQSLENDLSTYSSHLKAMKYFCEYAEKRTLVLIDEFGTGTEPQFGGAIAEAILEQLGKSKTFGIATTHYSNLKDLASKQEGMINGAMKYDAVNLEPLFKLEIGKPGSSFAFEIAGKIGLNESLINSARKKAGYQQVKYDELLSNLERERASFFEQNKKLTKDTDELKELRNDYEELRKHLDSEKKNILRAAKNEANQILSEANRKVEGVIREIREKQAEKEATKILRDKLRQDPIEKPKIQPKPQVGLKTGDLVVLEGQDNVGEIVSIKGKQVEVIFGLLKSFVEIGRLEKVSKKASKKIAKAKSSGVDMGKKMADFGKELDVRGKRAEEVLPILDKYLDEALMLGMNEVRILHGKGFGVLRDMIRNHLKGDPHVSSAVDEHIDRGGSGITIITMM